MQNAAAARPLKIKALDQADLTVVSALLQDALVPVSDMAMIDAERCFVLVANRFRWECPSSTVEEREVWSRTNAGIRVAGVGRVRYRGFSLAERGRILDLLAIAVEEGAVTLSFADGAAIRLEVDRIEVTVEDFGEPWPTTHRPSHQLD